MNGKNTNQKKRELASSISMGIQPNPLDCKASIHETHDFTQERKNKIWNHEVQEIQIEGPLAFFG